VQKYLTRISGPLLDRIDLHVEVTPVAFGELASDRTAEKSADIRERVMRARLIQEKRFENHPEVHCNSQMGSKLLRTVCKLTPDCQQLLKTAVERIGLSARAYDRILKVARTIADLEASPSIEAAHLSEAIQYRSLDREGWSG
jgi:magnesium chelatase family protein